jgi:nitrogen-specific signal transduction histidine kinase
MADRVVSDIEQSKSAFQQLQDQGYIRYHHLPLETKDGRQREVKFVSNVYDEDHHQVIHCNIRDVTEHVQRSEPQCRRKRWQIFTVAGRVRPCLHELHNPLAPILNAVHLLGLQRDESPFNIKQEQSLNAK